MTRAQAIQLVESALNYAVEAGFEVKYSGLDTVLTITLRGDDDEIAKFFLRQAVARARISSVKEGSK